MIYSLNQLLDWSRRAASDRLLRTRDVLVTDGTSDLLLTTGNNIQLTTLTVDSNPIIANGLGVNGAPYTITQDVNVLTFNPIPAAGLQAICVYSASNYADSDVINYLLDAAKEVMAKLGLRHWQVNDLDPNNPQLNDPCDSCTGIPVAEKMDKELEHLIVLKSALLLITDTANQNAGDAILIKDGDTTIDTSKTSAGSERAVKRLQDSYDQSFRIAVANRSSGVAIQNNWVPLPYPWSTPNMMPGEVNGPAY